MLHENAPTATTEKATKLICADFRWNALRFRRTGLLKGSAFLLLLTKNTSADNGGLKYYSQHCLGEARDA